MERLNSEKGVIVGRVATTTGETVKGASVVTTPIGHGARPVPDIAVLTNGLGRYKTPSLFPGLYRIKIVARGYRTAIKRVTVQTDRRVTLNFVVRRSDE